MSTTNGSDRADASEGETPGLPARGVGSRAGTLARSVSGACGYAAGGGAGVAFALHPSAGVLVTGVLVAALPALTNPRLLGTLALGWCAVRGKAPGPAGRLLVEHARIVARDADR